VKAKRIVERRTFWYGYINLVCLFVHLRLTSHVIRVGSSVQKLQKHLHTITARRRCYQIHACNTEKEQLL